jgi:uncharacterized protein (DUF1778 family)
MASVARSPSSRLDFRLTPEHKALIERAASVAHQSVTDFALATLVKAANEAIERASLTALSARDSKAFLHMLDSDAGPNAALRAAVRRYKKSRG